MSSETLAVLASLAISIIGVIGNTQLNNFRLKSLEEKIETLTDLMVKVAKLEATIKRWHKIGNYFIYHSDGQNRIK